MALKIVAEVGLDGSGFARGIDEITSHLKGLASQAFGLYAIEEAIRGTVEWASKLRDISDTLGVSTDWLQDMNYGLVQAGSNLDDLTKFMVKFAQARQRAMGGGAEGAKTLAAFSKLGISQEEVGSGFSQDLVEKLRQSLRKGITQELIPAFSELGGKAAYKMMAAFIYEVAGMDESIYKISEHTIDQLDELGDQFQRFGLRMKAALAPVIADVGTFFGKVLTGWSNIFSTGLNFFGRLAAYDKRFHGDEGIFKYFMDSIKYAFTETADEFGAELKAERDLKFLKEGIRANAGEKPEFKSPEMQFKPEHNVRGIPPYSDAMLAIGNFLGASSDALPRVANQQLNVLKQIETNTRFRSNSGTYYPP